MGQSAVSSDSGQARQALGSHDPPSKTIAVAYALDQKTAIRAGYGIFFIPNWIFFNLNPSNVGHPSFARERELMRLSS
jgi:hypothetical protein